MADTQPTRIDKQRLLSEMLNNLNASAEGKIPNVPHDVLRERKEWREARQKKSETALQEILDNYDLSGMPKESWQSLVDKLMRKV